MVKVIRRFEVWKVSLDPSKGSEIQKKRPCLVISPDEMNQGLHTVIIAPMSTTRKRYPSRIEITFQGKTGEVILDQIRTVDKTRLLEKMGKIQPSKALETCQRIQEMFDF